MLFDTETDFVTVGLQTPTEKLCVSGNIKVTQGHSFMVAKGGYSEFFETEETLMAGDVAGINPLTGLVRKYRPGDVFAGIATTTNDTGQGSMAGICIGGISAFDPQQVSIKNGIVFTPDNTMIGIRQGANYVVIK
jgi:hypothetical protein